MSSNSNDKVRAPIEIETSDIEQLNELIQDVKEAQSAARELEPMRGRKALTDERSAVRTEAFEDRGGIFGGETGKEQKFRDKGSRAAIQKENQFNKMKEDVQQIQATQYDMIGGLVNLGFLGGMTGGGMGAGQMIGKGMQQAQAGMKGGPMAMIGMGGGIMGGMKGMMLKGGIYGMIALMVVEIVQSAIAQGLAPGGFWERRFKRMIENEEVKFTDLREKEEISQGRRIIRVTTNVGLRGVSDQVRSNLDLYSSGKRIFDLDGTLMSKNTGWGNP